MCSAGHQTVELGWFERRKASMINFSIVQRRMKQTILERLGADLNPEI